MKLSLLIFNFLNKLSLFIIDQLYLAFPVLDCVLLVAIDFLKLSNC